ncbi:MAG: phosphopentomutase [Proteobacteria bacterium]|nr:phosphopentomutase [Pseudomonadota bacterium]NBY19138.1 phosphopentomutase [bacterium]
MSEKKFKRIVVLVADGFGVGAAPDANLYGDEGSNTLAHVAKNVGGIRLPNLQKMGLGNLGTIEGLPSTINPKAIVARLAEKSKGKDTTTGHWELAGLVTETPFQLFPNGFSQDLLNDFITEAKITGVLGNKAASGTEIIKELGEEHLSTGKVIVYTSGDSVFQIAAHEKVFGLERLYQICEVARRLTIPYQIGRVIARPFVGENSQNFKRTEHRKDFSISPPPNCLDVLQEHDVKVLSVGKIDDIFAHRGISAGNHTGNNRDSLEATLDFMKKYRNEQAFIFTNLVDFDQLYGHRRDPKGYAGSLVELDLFLPKLLTELTEDDCLILTSDHGCDPTFRGSDHTREFVPLVAYSPRFEGQTLGDRNSFSDVAASVLEAYQIKNHSMVLQGQSFLCKPKRS